MHGHVNVIYVPVYSCMLWAQDGGLVSMFLCTQHHVNCQTYEDYVLCNVSPDSLIVNEVSEVRAISIFTVALWWARCNQFIIRVSSFLLGSFKESNCAASSYLYLITPSVQYMYRTAATICTAQWSLYVLHSGHYMYRTVVTICSAQWSLYVPHSGHYMYRTVFNICTAQ